MLSVWYCLRYQHDWRLVVLAGAICSLACLAAVTLLRQQRGESRRVDSRWRIIAGLMTGFGVWCAHFVAMLGYDNILVQGYALETTGLSLLVAVLTTATGFAVASERENALGPVCAGGVVVGAGIAMMHYLGMSAVEFQGHFAWDPGLVLLSILFAVTLAVPALILALRHRGVGTGLVAGVVLLAAILSLHFTGMAAANVIPDNADLPDPHTLSPVGLGLVIGAIALAVLLIGAGAAIVNAIAIATIRSRGREFRILVEGITDCALYMLDLSGNVISWNAGACRLKGFESDEAIGLNFGSFYSDEERAAGMPDRALAEAREHGSFTAEGWRYRKDRTRFWANVTIESVIGDQGTIVGFAKITRDMSRQKEAQDRLVAMTEKLDAALTNMQQGLALFDQNERIALVNPRFRAMYRIAEDVPLEGLTFEEFIRISLGSRGGIAITEERCALGESWMRACLAQPDGGSVTTNFDDGGVIEISYRGLPEGGIVATFSDVSERHQSEARIAHMAMHDDLTGLPNRIHFNGKVDAAIARAAAGGAKVGIVAIDLDGFKEINDTYGHTVGDLVLRTLSERMSAVLGAREMTARFGGDEFAAACSFKTQDQIDNFADRLASIFHDPIPAEGMEIKARASLGVAVYPDNGDNREIVFGNADLAMYRAKATYGVKVCHYEFGMDEFARARRAMATDLRSAIARNELSLAFQVQRSVSTGETTGYEALIRWHHPVEGWISPEDFISVAEESGSIIEIGEWVLRRACEAAMRWPRPYRVAVNLSPVQLCNRELMPKLAAILLDTGLPPSRLELEITETAIIADKAAALHTLRQIKTLGVTIAIDDFGTGYSSLETLHSFPFDKIKIDRSFVLQSERSEQARAIIRAVIALGSNLGMPVLAEGVENETQLRMLNMEGCTEVQGYLLGRPAFQILTEDDIAA